MSGIPTVKVKHPDAPGDFMIINESDFDKNVHELFDGTANGGSTGDLPAGYEAKHSGGGKYKALVNDEPLKYGDDHEKAGEPAVFASKDDALAALKAFAAAQAATEEEAD